MYALIKAVKEIIEEKVIGVRNLRNSAERLDTTINIPKAFLYTLGQQILIAEAETAETHTVGCITDGLTLELCEPLNCGYTTDATIQKIYGGETVTAYIGEPPSIPSFPAITVDLVSRDQEPLTLQSVQEEYELRISVWVDKADYPTSLETLHGLTQIIEGSLFTTIYPLVEPYLETTLTEDVLINDDEITIADETKLIANTEFYLDDDEKTTIHRTIEDLGSGVFRLVNRINQSYAAGSRVWTPLVHTYGAQVPHITYDDQEQGSAVLKKSTLTYTVKIARVRRAI